MGSQCLCGPSAGGVPGGRSQPGQYHNSPLPQPGSCPFSSPPQIQTPSFQKTGQHPACQGQAELQPASPGRQAGTHWLYWKLQGKGSVGLLLGAEELIVPLMLSHVSTATVKPGFEGKGEGCVPLALPFHNPGISKKEHGNMGKPRAEEGGGLNLGRGEDGCDFICSTLKSSTNTRTLSKPCRPGRSCSSF